MYKSYIEKYFKKSTEYRVVVDSLEDIVLVGIKQYIKQKISDINSGKFNIDGIVGTNDICCNIAATLALQTNKISTTLKSILFCQNKYISRLKQQKLFPKHTPEFFLSSDFSADKILKLPIFVKPVRSSLSFYSFKVFSKKTLSNSIKLSEKIIPKHNQFYKQLIDLEYVNHKHVYKFNELICEQVVMGDQVTIDGYIFNNLVNFLGITKSIFLPNKISFTRFDYPFKFPETIENKIEEISKKLVLNIGLNNTLFNIEFVVDQKTEKIFIIEINSRLSSQFAYLIESVKGYNPFKIMCDISVGTKPKLKLKSGGNRYNFCSSCVLRVKNDKKVLRIPSEKEIANLEKKYKDIKINLLVQKGKHLSDYEQDLKTFRYSIIDIPGNSIQEIKKKLIKIKRELNFKFV